MVIKIDGITFGFSKIADLVTITEPPTHAVTIPVTALLDCCDFLAKYEALKSAEQELGSLATILEE